MLALPPIWFENHQWLLGNSAAWQTGTLESWRRFFAHWHEPLVQPAAIQRKFECDSLEWDEPRCAKPNPKPKLAGRIARSELLVVSVMIPFHGIGPYANLELCQWDYENHWTEEWQWNRQEAHRVVPLGFAIGWCLGRWISTKAFRSGCKHDLGRKLSPKPTAMKWALFG